MDRQRAAPTRDVITVSSFTADPLLRPASFWLHELELDARIELAPYGQLLQQLIDPNGALASNRRGCNLVLCRLEDWIRDRSTRTIEDNVAHLRTTAEEFLAALATSVARTSAATAVFIAPSSSASLARYGGRLEEIERELSTRLSAIERLQCWTHADLMRLYPVASVEDSATDELAHIPYTQAYFTALATLLARRLTTLFKPRWKVIAVDCDNTLWKGVCGEDGVEGIELTPAHLRFQRALVEQHDAGMLLCLCTKNNPRDVEAVFERRKDMLLRAEHLVGSRVNWAPKSSNLRALADEIGLALDSFVFIDDSALECAEVREHCPSVLTLQMPGTAPEIVHFIDHVWAFDRVGVTAEAARRTAQYKENRERSKAFAAAGELETFLASLNLEVSMEPMLPAHLARVAELTQRTNQFNLTTIRRTASDIDALCSSGDAQVQVVHVRDRFGDYGLVGVVVLREQASALDVDTFLLSCRALGRGVEFRIVNEIGRMARRAGVSHIVLKYRATERNVPARTFVHGSFVEFRAPAKDAGADEEVYLVPVDVADQLQGALQAAPVEEEETRFETQKSKEQPSHHWHGAALSLSRMTDLLRAIESSLRRIRSVANPFVAPDTSMERTVAAIWAEALGIDAVGAADDFFELGGDSLLAVQVVARTGAAMNRELQLHEFFAAPTVAKVSMRLLEAPPNQRAIQRVATDAPHPLSSAQRGMWLVDRIEGGGAAYHLPVALKFYGALDATALQDALDELVVRHEALRTVFIRVNGEPAQQVLPPAGLQLHTHDLQANESRLYIQEQLSIPFDLQTGPLIRASLLRLSTIDHVLLLIMHHIVSDGWSVGVLIGEFMALYEAKRGRADMPAPLGLQYRDYAHWQQQWISQDHVRKQCRYWEAALRGAPDLLQLPTDRPRPAIRSYRGATLGVALDGQFTADLRDFARHHGLTPAMVLYATWFILMSRLSGQNDIVVGVPVAGRRRTEVERLIGLFVNTLAVRVRIDHEAPVRDLLSTVKHSLLDAYSNQDVPFEQVVEAVRPTRSSSHNALFQTMLVLQGAPRTRERIGELGVSEQDVPLSTAKFDLTLSLQASGNELVGNVNYATDLFDAATAERWVEAFKVLLRAVIDTPERRIGRLRLLGADSRRQVLVDFNPARTDFPSDRLLHRIFEEQVERAPGAAAVVFEHATMSFAELNAKANQLARCLRSQDVGPGDLVALCVERGVEMVVGILGIWKAGAAYVPLDPDYPRERLQQILDDSAPKVLVQQRLRTHLPPGSALTVDLDSPMLERFETANLGHSEGMQSEQIAYVIYTSGSTGRPKGVMVEHRQVVNLWRALEHVYEQSPSCQRIAVNASFNFDASVKQFVQLLSGRTLVLIPQQVRWNAPVLLQLLEQQRVEGIDCTPMQLKSWSEAGLLSSSATLRVVLVGGEPIDAALWKRLSDSRGINFYNVYGPTECTVDATVAPLNGDSGSPHIGRPLPNTSIYIVDRHGEPVLIGMPGELHIGGYGVGRGYLGRPALTAERFLADPFVSDSGRMYRTGDLARWRHDGTIEYLGRNDHQVKLRGYRIELGEIEAHLTRHRSVKEAAVLVREDVPGQQRLVAYVVPSNEPGATLDAETLRRHLKEKLPEYMVPSAFVELGRLQQTANGKLDRRALPVPDGGAQLATEHEPPHGDMEQAVACIWQELLQVNRVGRDGNFFDLGGHSLLIMEVAASMQEMLGVEVPMRLLFEAPTVRQLAVELERLSRVQALQQLAGHETSADELLEKLAALPDSEVDSLLREMDMEERA